MKLLLTSDGLTTKNLKDFFISVLPKEPKNCSLLLVFYKIDIESEVYIEYTKEKIKDFEISSITPFDLHEEKFEDINKKFDIIWVCGGNTFLILDKIKKTGVFDFAKKAVLNNESIYIGISAGSIIAGPSIEIAGAAVGDYDENVNNLKDLSGLGFVDFVAFPHFKESMQEGIDKYRERVDYSVIEITDNEAICVEDNNYKIIK